MYISVNDAARKKLVADLLEIGIIEKEKDLLAVLANFAVQLYCQSRNIPFIDNNVLPNFLPQEHAGEFHILIKDLIGSHTVDSVLINKLLPALSKKSFSWSHKCLFVSKLTLHLWLWKCLPWGSDFSEDDVLGCRKIFKNAVGKSMKSYDLFVEKALSMLKFGGMLAFVLPEIILSVAAHDAVRKLIMDSWSFRFVSYSRNVFSGVQCPSVILGITPDNEKTVAGCKVWKLCGIRRCQKGITPPSPSKGLFSNGIQYGKIGYSNSF